MVIERTANEVIIRLPASVEIVGLQRTVDNLIYKEATSESVATQDQVDELAKAAKEGCWAENRERFIRR